MSGGDYQGSEIQRHHDERRLILDSMCEFCQGNYGMTGLSNDDLRERAVLCDLHHRSPDE